MKLFTRRILVAWMAITSALALSSGSANAAGADKKVHSGAQCQLEGNGNYWDGTPSMFGRYGGVFQNNHTNWDHVICPILRDQTQNLSGMQSVHVRIYNSGLGRGFWCELSSMAPFAGAGTVAGYPSFPVPLQFDHEAAAFTGLVDLSLSVSQSVADGSFMLHCEVPPQGVIYSYESSESTDTSKK
jgi:hypothetical protein